jgi:alkylation response protein AidB-like acyl-CoA dehydrogenase
MIDQQLGDLRLRALRTALRGREGRGEPQRVLERLVRAGALDAPAPGGGETGLRFAMLRSLGRHELSLARLAEGHLDALAILDEAGVERPEGRLGVWAAGPVEALRANRTAAGWRLRGIRGWCSGAGGLTHALVRAAAGDGERLFVVSLDLPGITPIPGSWPAIGMAASSTLDVRFEQVELPPEAAIGPPGFYLARDGFWFGAAGVAAVWLGGGESVARVAAEHAGDDPHRLAHVGWISARLAAMDALLRTTALTIDRVDADARLVEYSVRVLRAEVAETAAAILDRTGRATGAGPLSHDRDHARRVTDLALYIRQTHAEADLEELGRLERRLHRPGCECDDES